MRRSPLSTLGPTDREGVRIVSADSRSNLLAYLASKEDTVRPSLHFTPASGWINDPHGITARQNGYDVFFQHVPGQTTWGPNCHWGHATGPDLLTLTEGPIAIAPGDGEDGVWTGSIVGTGSDVRAFYTATSAPDFGIGRVRVATPSDATWRVWRKGDVVVEAPADLDLVAYRDPFIRRDGDTWRMFVGAAGRDGAAMALSYTSDDLDTWTYDGVALQRPSTERHPVWMGALWECPQVFDLDEQAVMLSSVWDADVLHYAGYALGSFTSGRFDAREWGRLTWGDSLYAPSLFTDAQGRQAVTFWLRGVEGDGWAGAHSVPYRVGIRRGRLVAYPHPDVAQHRTELRADGAVAGLAADIEWDGGEGFLTISSGATVLISFARADDNIVATTESSRTTFPVDGSLRIIVDGPIVEASSDAGVYAAAVRPGGADLQVRATTGGLRVHGLA